LRGPDGTRRLDQLRAGDDDAVLWGRRSAAAGSGSRAKAAEGGREPADPEGSAQADGQEQQGYRAGGVAGDQGRETPDVESQKQGEQDRARDYSSEKMLDEMA
jgi:hypothetical protein